MMLVPRRSSFDLLDDIFEDSFFKPSKVMKTDIKEHDNNYELIIDLPGIEKGDINISVQNGYLEVQAKTSHDETSKGKYVRRERYEGEFSRSFYIGENVTEDDIKASFKNGILVINVPKELETKTSSKKYINIE